MDSASITMNTKLLNNVQIKAGSPVANKVWRCNDSNGNGFWDSPIFSWMLSTKNTDYTILAEDSGTLFITDNPLNTPITFTLPNASAGLRFAFYHASNDSDEDIIIQAQSGDTIRVSSAGESSSGGNARTDFEGSTVTLVAINNTQWWYVALDGSGWSVN